MWVVGAKPLSCGAAEDGCSLESWPAEGGADTKLGVWRRRMMMMQRLVGIPRRRWDQSQREK